MQKEVTYTIVNPAGLPLAYPSVSDSDKPVGFFVLNEGKENFQRNTLREIRTLAKEYSSVLYRGCIIRKDEKIINSKVFPLGFVVPKQR